jgi:hypothetical protein
VADRGGHGGGRVIVLALGRRMAADSPLEAPLRGPATPDA